MALGVSSRSLQERCHSLPPLPKLVSTARARDLYRPRHWSLICPQSEHQFARVALNAFSIGGAWQRCQNGDDGRAPNPDKRQREAMTAAGVFATCT